MRNIPLGPAAAGAFAALFLLQWPLRARPEVVVESARPGEVVEMHARWRAGDETTPVRRLVTPFRMRLPRRGTFEGEFVAADARTRLRLTVLRPGLRPDTLMNLDGISVGTRTTEDAFHWGISTVGGGVCGEGGRINPAYRPLGRDVPLCLFAQTERKCSRSQRAWAAVVGHALLVQERPGAASSR